MICPRCRSEVPDSAPLCPRCRLPFVIPAGPALPVARERTWREALEQWLSFGDVPWKNFLLGGAIVALFVLWAIADIVHYQAREPKRVHIAYMLSDAEKLVVAFSVLDEEEKSLAAVGEVTVDVLKRVPRGWRGVSRFVRRIGRADYGWATVAGKVDLVCEVTIFYRKSARLRREARRGMEARVRVTFRPRGKGRLPAQSMRVWLSAA